MPDVPSIEDEGHVLHGVALSILDELRECCQGVPCEVHADHQSLAVVWSSYKYLFIHFKL